MHRSAIFVDAGYLMAQALLVLSSGDAKKRRNELRIIDPAKLFAALRQASRDVFAHDNFLRTYWYDGMIGDMTPEQESIAILPDVQFRAGTIHNKKQKGVDSRIVHDLFELASNHAIADAIVVTGDGDLAVGIEFAQRRGVRVALLSIEDLPSGVRPNRHAELLYLADRQISFDKAMIQSLFRLVPAQPASSVKLAKASPPVAIAPATTAPALPPPTPIAASAKADVNKAMRDAVTAVVSSLSEEALAATVAVGGAIITTVDRVLLAEARSRLHRGLETVERNELRSLYSRAVATSKSSAV